MLIADESVNKNLIKAMRNNGFEIFSIMQEMRSEKDIRIAEFSLIPARLNITEGKDFGEIVYHQNLKFAGVILRRLIIISFKINYLIIFRHT